MPRSNESHAESLSPATGRRPRDFRAPPDLESELLQAMQEFERGDYIELTVEELEHCAATGQSPWPDELPS